MSWLSGKKDGPPRSRKEEHDELILKVVQYVCAVSPGEPMKVLALGRSMETKSTSGEAGLQYQIKTNSGFGNLFLFPRFASIWMNKRTQTAPSIGNANNRRRFEGGGQSGSRMSAANWPAAAT
jgi:hypothetical protein